MDEAGIHLIKCIDELDRRGFVCTLPGLFALSDRCVSVYVCVCACVC